MLTLTSATILIGAQVVYTILSHSAECIEPISTTGVIEGGIEVPVKETSNLLGETICLIKNIYNYFFVSSTHIIVESNMEESITLDPVSTIEEPILEEPIVEEPIIVEPKIEELLPKGWIKLGFSESLYYYSSDLNEIPHVFPENFYLFEFHIDDPKDVSTLVLQITQHIRDFISSLENYSTQNTVNVYFYDCLKKITYSNNYMVYIDSDSLTERLFELYKQIHVNIQDQGKSMGVGIHQFNERLEMIANIHILNVDNLRRFDPTTFSLFVENLDLDYYDWAMDRLCERASWAESYYSIIKESNLIIVDLNFEAKEHLSKLFNKKLHDLYPRIIRNN